jgi:hypothetical protein
MVIGRDPVTLVIQSILSYGVHNYQLSSRHATIVKERNLWRAGRRVGRDTNPVLFFTYSAVPVGVPEKSVGWEN